MSPLEYDSRASRFPSSFHGFYAHRRPRTGVCLPVRSGPYRTTGLTLLEQTGHARVRSTSRTRRVRSAAWSNKYLYLQGTWSNIHPHSKSYGPAKGRALRTVLATGRLSTQGGESGHAAGLPQGRRVGCPACEYIRACSL